MEAEKMATNLSEKIKGKPYVLRNALVSFLSKNVF